MSLLPQSIERIISIGGSVSVDASYYLPMSLDRFASLAVSSGAKLYIRNAQKLLPVSLERIAAIGRGVVVFEFN
ncbi:MAG: hypothetical protein V4469_04150 [Patescibacteria group bacterium]